jgi:large subunit ribosomal protein L22
LDKKHMIIKSTQLNTRQTPRKVRLVANTVKKMSLNDALRQLGVIERRSTLVIMKVIRQAVANAIHNFGYSADDLKLKNILVTEGPRLKRFRAVSRGRAHNVVKRTSHITVELEAAGPAMGSTKVEQPAVTEQPAETEKSAVIEKPAAKKTATKKTAAKREVTGK